MLSSDGSGHLHAWILYQIVRLSYKNSDENLPHGHHICKRLCLFWGSVRENIGQINWLGAVHLFVLRQSTVIYIYILYQWKIIITSQYNWHWHGGFWWMLYIMLASMWRGCIEKFHVNAKCQKNTWSLFSAFLLMSIYLTIFSVSTFCLFKRICNYR